MRRFAVASLMAALLVSGCDVPVAQRDAGMMSMREGPAAAYGEHPTLTTSLFKSDQAVMDDEAIRRILSSNVVLAEHARIALLKFPGAENAALRYYGYHYWRSEDYLKTQQEYIDTISGKLMACDRVAEVILLPSLLTPPQATIPTCGRPRCGSGPTCSWSSA